MAKQKKEQWSQMDFETKKRRLTELWEAGHSDEKIGDMLSARKGQIVGFRHRHLSGLTGESRGTPSGAPPAEPSKPERTPDPPVPRTAQEHRPMTLQSGFAAMDTTAVEPKRKMASSLAKQCDHVFRDDDRQCGFEWTVRVATNKYCATHAKLYK